MGIEGSLFERVYDLECEVRKIKRELRKLQKAVSRDER